MTLRYKPTGGMHGMHTSLATRYDNMRLRSTHYDEQSGLSGACTARANGPGSKGYTTEELTYSRVDLR